MEAGLTAFVTCGNRQMTAVLLDDRLRHRILEVEGDQIAKIVSGSRAVREGDCHTTEVRHRTRRNRDVWQFLKNQEHPGLLKVHERVVDDQGDEGFLCERLYVHDFKHGKHPIAKTLGSILDAAIALADAVGILHERDIVHGDITPYNVGLRGEYPVLIDFEMWTRSGQRTFIVSSSGRQQLICCTPSCASPEQVMGHEIYPSSDVYCIALTVLSWITGKFGVCESHDNQTSHESMAICARGEYPHWQEAQLLIGYQPLIAVLSSALSYCPYDRYIDANVMATALRGVKRRATQAMLARFLSD